MFYYQGPYVCKQSPTLSNKSSHLLTQPTIPKPTQPHWNESSISFWTASCHKKNVCLWASHMIWKPHWRSCQGLWESLLGWNRKNMPSNRRRYMDYFSSAPTLCPSLHPPAISGNRWDPQNQFFIFNLTFFYHIQPDKLAFFLPSYLLT